MGSKCNKIHRNHNTSYWVGVVMGGLVLGFMLLVAQAAVATEPYDAQLSQAERLVTQIEQRLASLTVGDSAGYNRLSAQLTKAGKSLKATESKQHAKYLPLVKRWSELQQVMVSTASQCQQAQVEVAAQKNSTTKAP